VIAAIEPAPIEAALIYLAPIDPALIYTRAPARHLIELGAIVVTG
jgi:hypothetical protein